MNPLSVLYLFEFSLLNSSPSPPACGTYEQLEYWANNFDDFAVSSHSLRINVALYQQKKTIQVILAVKVEPVSMDLLSLCFRQPS